MFILFYYCLKVIICSGLLFGYYLLALRNNRFHQWNRYYLLAAAGVAFILPLLRIPVMFSNDSNLITYSYQILSGPEMYFTFIQKQHHFSLTMPVLLLSIYILITILLLSLFVHHIIRILHLRKSYSKEQIDHVSIYQTTEAGTPFSFFKNIFWNSTISLNTVKGQQMLRHELTHVQENHSADKVIMELLIAFAWWNPILYFIRKELSVIHEFIADKKASAGDAKLQYASLLLMKAMGSEQYVLGNPFFHSQIKRRLMMLTTIKKQKFGYLRRLVALPLSCILVALFAVQCERTHEELNTLSQSKEATATKSIKTDSTTATGKLPSNALYIINGIESSKKEAEELKPNEIKSMNVLTGDVALKEYGSKGANGVILITSQASKPEVVFSKVEVPASFPGGIDGWRRYLEHNLKYPEAAQKKGTQGVVRMQMVVNENGNIIDIKALNDPGDGLAAEALRVIRYGPKWVPAKKTVNR